MGNLIFIVIYDHPADYPDKYAARLFCGTQPTDIITTAETYEDLLEAVTIRAKIVFKSDPKDDPVILETWLCIDPWTGSPVVDRVELEAEG